MLIEFAHGLTLDESDTEGFVRMAIQEPQCQVNWIDVPVSDIIRGLTALGVLEIPIVEIK